MMELIKMWRERYESLQKLAEEVDQNRMRNPKYYSSMTDEEKRYFNDLIEKASRYRIEAAATKKCYHEAVAQFTTDA